MKTRITIGITPDVIMRLKRLREHYSNLKISAIYTKLFMTGLEFVEREIRNLND